MNHNDRLSRLESKRPTDYFTPEHEQAIIDAAFEPGMTDEQKEVEILKMKREREAYLRKYR